MVIAIIGIMASMIFVSVNSAIIKARDVKRKAELTQIGRFLSASSCYLPNAGGGDYDVADLLGELKIKYPQYANYINQAPRDPKSGTDLQYFYRYTVTNSGNSCALYANLEKADEPITLTSINIPTPGGGTGVFEAMGAGWNGTSRYFQVSR